MGVEESRRITCVGRDDPSKAVASIGLLIAPTGGTAVAPALLLPPSGEKVCEHTPTDTRVSSSDETAARRQARGAFHREQQRRAHTRTCVCLVGTTAVKAWSAAVVGGLAALASIAASTLPKQVISPSAMMVNAYGCLDALSHRTTRLRACTSAMNITWAISNTSALATAMNITWAISNTSAPTCLVVMPCVTSAVVVRVFSWPSSRSGDNPRISAASASLALLVVAGSRVSSSKVLMLAPTCLSMGGETALATSMVVACEGERERDARTQRVSGARQSSKEQQKCE